MITDMKATFSSARSCSEQEQVEDALIVAALASIDSYSMEQNRFILRDASGDHLLYYSHE